MGIQRLPSFTPTIMPLPTPPLIPVRQMHISGPSSTSFVDTHGMKPHQYSFFRTTLKFPPQSTTYWRQAFALSPSNQITEPGFKPFMTSSSKIIQTASFLWYA